MSAKQPVGARVLAMMWPLLLTAVRPLVAQARSAPDLGGIFIEAGGEEERYLRVLQLAGRTPLTPWSIQPFSPTQVAGLRAAGAHPWKARYDTVAGHAGAHVLRPSVGVIANTSFPVQVANGPTWAGRGLTGQIQAGVAGAWKGLNVQLAPMAFEAQNASFTVAPNGLTGEGQYADARYPDRIDLPQRFGTSAYGRVDPGSSILALDAYHLLAGIGSAAQRWGPARDYPLVLGPNAGGFPNLFAGTSEPIDFWLFRGHGRLVYGELGQSKDAPSVDGERRRLGSGLVLVALPRGVPGLEIGAARFIQREWFGDIFTWSVLSRPFLGVVSSSSTPGNTQNDISENQTGSLFARWAFPSAQAEFYGEFYKEDYWGGFHVAASSLVEKPDDYSVFTLGFQKVLVAGDKHIRVLRGEIVNGETSHQERDQRGFTVPLPPYVHAVEVQGHTVNGLLLGSPEAYGGSGWRVGIDDFTPAGRRSVSFERSLRLDWLPTLPAAHPQVEPDVIYGVRFELLRFAGRRDYGVTLIPAIDLNRNLVAHNDVFNLAAAITVRGW